MKNKFLIILPLLVLGFVAFGWQTPTDYVDNSVDTSCAVDNTTFSDGEEIVYKLYYNWNFVWISAGEVRFRVKDIESQYYVSAYGHTYSSYDWMFKVRDKYEAYIDKQSLLPVMAVRNVEEGNFRLYDKVGFNQERNFVVSERGKTSDKTKKTQYNIPNCTHDVLSAIYYIRNVDFEQMGQNAKVPLTIFMDKETWPLGVRYKGKKKKKKIKGLGTFNCLQLSPEVIAGDVFDENTEMNIWVSDDQNKIPLLIESPISVGSVKAVLKSYKGLKYDMTSKIK